MKVELDDIPVESLVGSGWLVVGWGIWLFDSLLAGRLGEVSSNHHLLSTKL